MAYFLPGQSKAMAERGTTPVIESLGKRLRKVFTFAGFPQLHHLAHFDNDESLHKAILKLRMEDKAMLIERSDTYYRRMLCMATIVIKRAQEDQDVENDMDIPYACPLTATWISDPVITPYGFTYERAALMQWLSLTSPTDPHSQQPLTADQLIPNRAIRAASATFAQLYRKFSIMC
jgi:hypothetical protein